MRVAAKDSGADRRATSVAVTPALRLIHWSVVDTRVTECVTAYFIVQPQAALRKSLYEPCANFGRSRARVMTSAGTLTLTFTMRGLR
jgi:hypothetical protein